MSEVPLLPTLEDFGYVLRDRPADRGRYGNDWVRPGDLQRPVFAPTRSSMTYRGAAKQDRGASRSYVDLTAPTADEITYASSRRIFQEKAASNHAAMVLIYHVSDPRLPKNVDGLTNEQRARVLKDEERHRKNGIHFVHYDR